MLRKTASGFTLIEVLIALAITAIAVTAVIKATSQNIRSTTYLQSKTIAMWVGENIINQARVGLITLSEESNDEKDSMIILGQTMYWQGSQEQTPNKHIYKLNVKVFANEHEESPLINLTGYRYDDQAK